MEKEYLHRFYKKSHEEKIKALKNAAAISEEDYAALKNETLKLASNVANQMIENYILNYEFPFGVAMNFVIDGNERLIPMVTEEPSVVAAARDAGKIVGQSGSVQTQTIKRLMIGRSEEIRVGKVIRENA